MVRPSSVVSPFELKREIINGLQKIKTNPGIDKYLPHETQLKFHQSKAKGKLFMGGNRAGKTVGGGAEMAMRMTGRHPYRDDLPRPPIRARAVAVDFDRGINKIIIPELQKWIPTEYLINGKWEDSYNKSDKTLVLNNNSFIEFMSYEQLRDKFQGTSRHVIWFDEEPPEEIFEECMARLIDTDGDYYITMTPLIEMSWTYSQLYEPARDGQLISVELFEAQTKDNPHINMDAFDRLTQTMTEEERKTRGTGVYISHTGLVYGESFSRTRNVIPDIRRSNRFSILKNDWAIFEMMDHGYNNPTAFLFAAADDDGRVIIFDEIYKNKTLVGDLATLVKRKREALGISPEYTVGDPSIKSTDPLKGGSVQAEYAENGVYISLGNNDVQTGIVAVQKMFQQQQLFITENCSNLLKEIFKYKWDRHLTKAKDRRNQKETPLKKDDHAMDALRYGIMSRPHNFSKLEEEPERTILNPDQDTGPFDYVEVKRNNQLFDEVLGSEF